MFKSLWSLIEKNRGMFVALLAAVLLFTAGCMFQAKVKSPISGGNVTQPELDREFAEYLSDKQAEVEKMSAKVNASQEELAKKQALIDDIVGLASTLAGAAGPYGGLLTAGLGLLTGGGVYDAVRRKRVIDVFKDTLKSKGIDVPKVA